MASGSKAHTNMHSLPTGEELAAQAQLDIEIARYNYRSSLEKLKIEKWRKRVYWCTVLTGVFGYIFVTTFYFEQIQLYFPSVQPQQLGDYTIVAMICSIALGFLISFIAIRDRSWSHIYVHYNQAAIDAAEQRGAPPRLIPKPTDEEIERSRKDAELELAKTGSLSFSDWFLFGATGLAIIEIAFKQQELAILVAAILILGTKFRLMLYAMARFGGAWQGPVMYLGATALILAVFAYADGKLWHWMAL